ncbi:glycosyltransferase family 32 protein [Bacteroides sp. 224]|uniref:glycosyltransferase family 32 protein n=1 Tax=Bacteroides sp. 224 TaxID=2302936 RepID=UPI0013D25E17|nr:glycosyltransferase [Bacteroides sp. 224]NDV64199.1 hypothetical protein [Bacteroides sp. 224]
MNNPDNVKIPLIIHQIWSGVEEPLPQYFEILSKTWKHDYPDWKYEFWDNERMNKFIIENYPEYWERYNKFQYNIQRWDAIRYLILNQMGGMYVDFDYESIQPLDPLLLDKTCCFSQEPISHYRNTGVKSFTFNNALILSTPNHFFMKKIITEVFSEKNISKRCENKAQTVFETTGPFVINKVYKNLTKEEMSQVHLIPPEFVSPFDFIQSRLYRNNIINLDLESSLRKAYAVHYFLGAWIPSKET